jgi:glycogen debranching enzyme
MRGGEMAALREVPFGLYYGSVDSTPLFVLLAGLYFERTGDLETIKELWSAIDAALKWIDGPGDVDRDGFVEYRRLSADGLANQGWKDSYDAIFHEDGRLAEGDIALVEVQGYVFAAKRLAAQCARRMGLIDRARALETDAERLAENFEAAFWCPQIGTYALALDGDKNPCRVRSSNAGQALFSGVVKKERAGDVAKALLGANSFSGWGVRTIAKSEVRYNPMSYHNGSVWPHDNALIALGFSRYGLKGPALRVFGGLFAAAKYMDLRRLPELFCGFQRQRQRRPTLYPVACAPQAWASAVPFALLAASLGFEFDSERMEVRLRNPQLPPFLEEVTIKSLRLKNAEADISVRRGSNNDVALEVIRSNGTVTFAIVPPV